MNLKKLLIENYKSLRNINISEPDRFTVFVGPNAAGKSNIFESIQFAVTLSQFYGRDTVRSVGNFIPYENKGNLNFKSHFNKFESAFTINSYDKKSNGFSFTHSNFMQMGEKQDKVFGTFENYHKDADYIQFFTNFSRIFVKNKEIDKLNFDDDYKLSPAAGNLEKVLKRIFKDKTKKDEILEWLQLLIPGLENIEIKSEELSDTNSLLIYEKGTLKPFTKNLISDGTYNIIALLTAVYQSDEPQFLCIEEPENGLNPKVVKELVGLFREKCKEKGHYIWLNTHSQTLVRELTSKEIIIVDKIEGETKVKQIQNMNLHGVPMDEALLSNMIGGGIPW